MRIDRVKLSTEMARRDMTSKAVAAKSGVSRATISSVKSGKSCSTRTGLAIASALGVPVEQLMEGGNR